MTSDTLIVVLVAAVMAVGLAGTVLPVLPGLWLMWGAALGYGLMVGFNSTAWTAMAVVTAISAGGTALTVLVPHKKAAKIGVPAWGQIVAAAAAVVGMFLIPVLGAPIGFFAGVMAVHIVLTKSVRSAPAAAWATLTSMAVVSGIQFVAGLALLAVWIAWVIV